MVYNNVLEALGHTPLIRLNRFPVAQSAEVLVNYEAVNIGGSIKTRLAYNMFREAERRGDITKDHYRRTYQWQSGNWIISGWRGTWLYGLNYYA